MSPPPSTGAAQLSRKPWDIEEIRRQAREAWLSYRAREAAKSAEFLRNTVQAAAQGTSGEREAQPAELTRKDDFSI